MSRPAVRHVPAAPAADALRGLEDELPGGHQAACSPVPCGTDTLHLYHVQDPNALADAVDPAQFAADERFPYWAELWPSAVALARFLLRRQFPGVRAVELGCGLGLAGVAAARRGAAVLFTDFESAPLTFAAANHARNLGRPGRTRLLDWRAPPADLRASLVLASDVLYERRFFAPFRNTLDGILEPGGTALVAEPGRDIANSALRPLERAGYRHTLELEEFGHRGRAQQVWIHVLEKPAPARSGSAAGGAPPRAPGPCSAAPRTGPEPGS